MNLFELSDRFENDVDALTAMYEAGELSKELFDDTMEGLGGDVKKKCVNIAKHIRNKEALANGINEEIKKMGKRAKTAQATADYFSAYLLKYMLDNNVNKIESDCFNIHRKTSEKVELSGSIDNVATEFVKTPKRELMRGPARKQLLEDREKKIDIDRGFGFVLADYIKIG